MQGSRGQDVGTGELKLVADGEPTVSVVVPALNEENGIDWVLEHVRSCLTEVVLVDSLSIDLTEAIARKIRSDIVLVHQRQPGRARSCAPGSRRPGKTSSR